MLLDHLDPDCPGSWAFPVHTGRRTVSCARCGAAYAYTARVEDAADREYELERLLAYLGSRGRALLRGGAAGADGQREREDTVGRD